MRLLQLDHYNVRTACPEETVRFYCDVLGFTNEPARRPNFDNPGAWLFVEGHPAVHLLFVDDDQAGPTGAIDHVAFTGADYLGTCAELEAKGVAFSSVESPHLDLIQIFLTDPNQIRIEINFTGERDSGAGQLEAQNPSRS